MNSDNRYYNDAFSHIYVEEAVREHPRVKRIISRFPKSDCIRISHYKDIFCRKKQSFSAQHRAPALILAARQGKLVYPGACVCQSFGNQNFYYTSCMMNCIYDCEYCYLRGMYSSGNIVIFVNLEDIFAEVEGLLRQHPVYLCISYDTDLMALNDITGFVEEWVGFAGQHPGLRLEIRTKCGRSDLWEKLEALPEVIYAFTLSPEYVVVHYEHRTSSLQSRLACAARALSRGFPVRLCFDPMIYCPDWERHYGAMWNQVKETLDLSRVTDVSIGSFRIGRDYLKRMRKQTPLSAVVQYPFENRDGVYHYPEELIEKMESFLKNRIQQEVPSEKIFCWNSGETISKQGR